MFSQSVPLQLLPKHSVGPFGRVQSMARALAFWLAVALPLAYLPVVVMAPGVLNDPTLLFWAVIGNLVALVIGHGHEPSLDRHRHHD